MAKDDQSNSLSPFQRFEKLAKALFAVPKKEADQKNDEEGCRKRTIRKAKRTG